MEFNYLAQYGWIKPYDNHKILHIQYILSPCPADLFTRLTRKATDLSVMQVLMSREMAHRQEAGEKKGALISHKWIIIL